jgi:hypothetical protein
VLLISGRAALALGAVTLAAAAVLAVRAVWRWERTHLVVTTQRLAVLRGTMRRRGAAVPLVELDVLELDQSLPGRVFGYGTVIAGPLEIDGIPRPREVCRLLGHLAA